MNELFYFDDLTCFEEENEDDSASGSGGVFFFIALAGQTANVILLAGSATDKLLQSGH